jgi:putative ABC transport system permease protein
MNWLQDLQFAFRIIRKRPWFSAAIVLTLALGMGVNTTVFSLVNAVLFKPLPFPGGERLVMVNALVNGNQRAISYPDYRDFRQSSASFEQLEAFAGDSMTLGERDNPPDRYQGGHITAGMFAMIHANPVIGRGIEPADEKSGRDLAVLIGYGIWKDRYGKDPGVIGRPVRVDEKPGVIIGVMPEGFKFPQNENIWVAVVPDAETEKRNNYNYSLIGILKQRTSVRQAQADMSLIAQRIAKEFADTHKDRGVSVQTFHDAMNGGPIRLVFLLMLGAVGFVLLIACANVANMLLGRAVERTREVSVRAAMGASRWRLVRQLLIESIVLSVFGGLLGLGLARLGTYGFGLATADVGKPYWIDFSMNYVVFGYFAGVTILAGLIFGLVPALSVSRVDLNQTLKDGARGSSGGSGGYLSGALVVFQFTLAVVLLTGAGLMMRSFLRAQDEFSNLDGPKIMSSRVGLPRARYAKAEDRRHFYERLLPRLASIPGVQQVAMVSNGPGEGSARFRFEVEGKTIIDAEQRPWTDAVAASKDYFSVLGLHLLRGRDFEPGDGLSGKETVIINQDFATRFFPNTDAIGKQIRLYEPNNKVRSWVTVIGVVPDFRQRGPSNETHDPVIFLPHNFDSNFGMRLLLKTQGNPSALAAPMRHEVQQIDQDLPLSDTQTLAEGFKRQRWYFALFGSLFLIFAMVAMGMAAVGIYAVMANDASRRTREIGVRMALGANVGSILSLILGRGMKQLAIGMVLGIGAALAVCRLMAGLLYGVSPQDPLTFVTVALTLASVGIAAIYFPARRAARLDPLRALRYE